MFRFYPVNSILMALAFLSLGMSLLFPVEKVLQKLFTVKVPKTVVVFFIPLLLVAYATFTLPADYFFMFLLTLVNLWAFLYAVNVDRKYIYFLAIFFLSLAPLFLLMELENAAEYFAVLSYLALVIGVFRDIFYEKVFKA